MQDGSMRSRRIRWPAAQSCSQANSPISIWQFDGETNDRPWIGGTRVDEAELALGRNECAPEVGLAMRERHAIGVRGLLVCGGANDVQLLSDLGADAMACGWLPIVDAL